MKAVHPVAAATHYAVAHDALLGIMYLVPPQKAQCFDGPSMASVAGPR